MVWKAISARTALSAFNKMRVLRLVQEYATES